MSNDVTKPGSPVEQFQERVAEKLREDIGSLMPQEVLEEMTRKILDEGFFKQIVEKDEYGRTGRVRPSQAQVVVMDYFGEQVEKAATRWADDHKEELIKLVQKQFKQGVVGFMLNALGDMADQAARKECQNLADNLRSQGINSNYWG